MAGMGKTALAQQVFDYFTNVKKEHFDFKFWVCDSLSDLNASSLMKKILGESESGLLGELPVKLKEKLRSKRFLLVLDDAWDDKNQNEWEKLCHPLKSGRNGSWILLTTRLESVAQMISTEIKGTIEPMKLQGLSNDECRSLLYEHAFSGQDPDEFPQLKDIGEQIMKKLNGVPLLAKSIGGALNNKLEASHWTNISNNKLWTMRQDLDRYEFIPSLTLSYKMLPPRLKRCFSYCGIFPQDYLFEKQKLVHMWVAAGLIYSEGSEEGSDEDIANYCFNMLCNKSFFEPYNSGNDYYTMHDMLNGLARHVSRYECCRIVDGTSSRILDYNAIRHIYISCCTDTGAQLCDLTKMVCEFKHLRTLWIEYDGHSQQFADFIRDACKSPRRIRVLIVKSSDFEVSDQCLKSISDFAKVRFLQIPSDFLSSLSMRKFYFLQVLIQELDFAMGTKPIDELMHMANLHQLSIKQLSNVQSLKEVNKLNLVSKSSLTRLELGWDEASSNSDLDQQKVLAALKPPPTIRELCLRHYKGGRPAPWMDTLSLSRLEHLHLDYCASLEELPPLWKLPCLKFLKLNQMKAIRSLGCDSSDQMDIQFPSLEKLEFRDLPLWEEWNGADDYIWFPHLKTFEILLCPKLKKIPDLPLSIESLCMKILALEALPWPYKCSNDSGRFLQLMSLESLEICECPKIVLGEEHDQLLPSSLKTLKLENIGEHKYLASYLRGLTLLTRLNLHSFPGLESLPLASGLEHLTALQDLHISDFKALTSPGGLYVITSLKSLKIYDCPKFLFADVESQEFLKGKTRDREVSSSSASNKTTTILPSSLESLEFHKLDISQESLGRCLQGLTSLKMLEVSDCHHLVSLPFLHNLTELQELSISDCKELCELESLTALVSLRELQITNCPKLLATTASILQHPATITEQSATASILQHPATITEQSATKIKKGTLPSLELIYIDSFFYLPILPIPERQSSLSIDLNLALLPHKFTCFSSEIVECLLQYRESLKYLTLAEMPHLQSLPASLESFSLLKSLSIIPAPELKSLPKMPASLERLNIYGCSANLKKRCQENIGLDWPNIKHIPHIFIVAKDDEDEDEDEDEAQVNCNWISSKLWSSTST